MKITITIMVTMLLAGCSGDTDTSILETKGIPPETNMRINHYTVDCVGEAPGKCLLTQEGNHIGTEQWEYFYFKDDIIGFSFEPGYVYNLEVEKTPVANPPQDGPAIRYELIEILSREKQ